MPTQKRDYPSNEWVVSFCFTRKGLETMKTEKPDIRVFCYKCWMNYMNAGMHYLQIYTEFKDSCEICGHFNGYEYIEVKKRR